MDKKISVSEEALNEIYKSISNMVEENYSLLNTVSKSIDSAENDGWTDSRFIRFRDEFLNAERLFREGNSYFEDILLPEIKRIQILIENY